MSNQQLLGADRGQGYQTCEDRLPLTSAELRKPSTNSIEAASRSSDSGISDYTENLQGIGFMALSALSFSLMFLGVKLYSNAPTFTLVFYRSVVQAILSLVVMLTEGITSFSKESNYSLLEHVLGPPSCRNLLVLRGAFGSLAVAAFFYAIQNLPLPDAVTLQFTTPVFAAVLAVPLLGEKWCKLDQLGAFVCFGGVLLMTRPPWLVGATTEAPQTGLATIATLIGLIGAALAALAYLLVRKIGSRADANTMVLYYAVISALTAPMGARLLDGVNSWEDFLANPSEADLIVFASLGVFGFLGQLWTNIGLTKCESAATATLITNTQIVFAYSFEVLILHKSLSPWSMAGTTLIVGYMLGAGFYKQRESLSRTGYEKEVIRPNHVFECQHSFHA